jgi:hypothetical protein
MTRLLLACVLVLAGCGALGAGGCGSVQGSACTRVLFIGNSYTFANDLPGTFAGLARAGGHAVETGMVAEGGATLADAAGSTDVARAITSSRWGYVILQEQSVIPAVAWSRDGEMYPAARTLAATVAGTGAQPMLFQTWAHRDGWPEGGLPDYASMQRQIDDGYLTVARGLGLPVAPVGDAWAAVRRTAPGMRLWQDDGSHPSAAGTYLAACVFYAAVFHQRPDGLSFRPGLDERDALLLQGIAADAVLSDPARWGLR